MFDKNSKEAELHVPQNPPVSPISNKNPSTMIGVSSKIKGELSGDEDMVIQGNIEGTVQLKNNSVSVGEHGVIQADVFAKKITIEGKLSGDLHGTEKVIVTRSGQVKGNIISPRVVLEDGASFKGSIDMDCKTEAQTVIESANKTSAKSKTG